MKPISRRLVGLALCLLPAALLLPRPGAARDGAPAPAPRPDTGTDAHGFAGGLSCSGRGCHGAITPNPPPALPQNEFTLFSRGNPHARAFDALKSDRARRMAENLALLNGGKVVKAHEDPKCLACHSTPQLAAGTSAEMRALQAQGISCEVCHGAALKDGDGWLTQHTTDAWQKLSAADKERRGMRTLSDPRTLASVCVGCHVGAPADAKNGLPGRDLNHDLMAVGHPRLLFELTTDLANMTPHWRPEKDVGGPGREAKLWAVGRVESARAALALLDSRANEAAKPWPEFSEYGCFSCHSSLRAEGLGWRHRPAYRDPKVRGPGRLAYNAWPTAGLPQLAKAVGGDDGALQNDLAALAHLMSEPSPDRKKVGEQAAATLRQVAALSDKVGGTAFTRDRVRELMKGLAAVDEKTLAAMDWDETAQRVYALAALYADGPDADAARHKEVTDQFTKVYRSLAFPPGFESPADFRRAGATRETDQLTDELKKLVELLGKQ